MTKFSSLVLLAILALSAFTATGCSYAGVATTSDGYAVVTRNDQALSGMLRKVFVCKVSPTGLQNCQTGISP